MKLICRAGACNVCLIDYHKKHDKNKKIHHLNKCLVPPSSSAYCETVLRQVFVGWKVPPVSHLIFKIVECVGRERS